MEILKIFKKNLKEKSNLKNKTIELEENKDNINIGNENFENEFVKSNTMNKNQKLKPHKLKIII